jgi:hypothetical protein
MVYIGSDEPLGLIPWDKDSPALCIEELNEHNQGVVCQFAKPYVYYVGSYEGCGCGFQHSPYLPEDDDDREQDRLVAQSRQQLRELIERLLARQKDVELFSVWAGGETKPPSMQRELSPEDLTTTHRKFFDEGEFIRFTR